MNQGENTIADALRALKNRGVNQAGDLIEIATPDQIVSACHRWDCERNASPGLLVYWIRHGKFAQEPLPAQSKAEQLRARFDEYAAAFPVGSIAEPHVSLQARRNYDDDPCPGDLIVTETSWPTLVVRCDRCDFEAAFSPRALQHLQLQGLSSEDVF